MSYLQSDEPKIKGAASFKIGIGLLILAAISSTLAANISINGSNRVEFSQGVYTVRACNDWIQIEVSYGETVDGLSPITGFVFRGINPFQCSSTTLTFKVFEDLATEPATQRQLNLYATESDGTSGPVNEIRLAIDSTGTIFLVDPESTPIDEESAYVSSSLNQSTRDFTVGFSYPLAWMEDLDNITVESGPNGL
jgi:hypothetical protein